MRRSAGLTLVELLIGMAILGIILTVGSALMISTGRISNQQDRLVEAAASARLALFRLSEIVRQASYVYPSGTTITIAGQGSFTTGEDALAVLVPAGSTYCDIGGALYCGFLYGVTDRSAFTPPLPAQGATNEALVEMRVEGIDWPKDAVPALALTNWPAGAAGLVSDGLDRSGTNLGGRLHIAPFEAVYDASVNFSIDPTAMTARSLVNGADVSVNIRRIGASGDADSQQRVEVFTRSVPRSAPPNLD